MIEDIIKGKESSRIIVIKDNVDCCSRYLLKSICVHLQNHMDSVHMLKTEFSENLYKSSSLTNLPSIKIHDWSMDPLGWNQPRVTFESNLHTYFGDILAKSQTQQKVAVVVDAISSLIQTQGIVKICQQIQSLKNDRFPNTELTKIVLVVHEDLHESLAALDYTASTIIYISHATPSQSICDTLHKRPSGKVKRSNELLIFGIDGEISSAQEISQDEKEKETEEDVDPAANLTFNLSLKDSEKKAREQLQLPYMFHQQGAVKSGPATSVTPGTGQIYYECDDVDDFDEEDPDDDLNI
ncbi:unnamed protein product [Owenia fusiformis]|uniref:Elongator complex protein 5 n=1 Tax=Owenia fusiformis TaxID=6347 RepID=A0A8S4NP79_OWEFU|nr:unnamed protein product [Owenia fusiformis]